jgi:hypothetical protein
MMLFRLVLVGCVVTPIAFVGGPAQAQEVVPPRIIAPVVGTTVIGGERVSVVGEGCEPNADVTVELSDTTGREHGTVVAHDTAAVDGRFTSSFTVPILPDETVGIGKVDRLRIRLLCGTPTFNTSVDIRYRVPLPRTGTSSGPLALVALVSLGVGLLLIVVSRSLNQDATGG